MSFTAKYKRSPEILKYLEASLRDLTVNAADYLGVAVDSLTISIGSAEHGFAWTWILDCGHPYSISLADNDLDTLIERAKIRLATRKGD